MSSDNDVTDLGLDDNEEERDGSQKQNEALDVLDTGFRSAETSDDSINGIVVKDKEHVGVAKESDDDNTITRIETEAPSTPDGTLSLQDSILSCPQRPRLASPGHSFKPFDRRFTARLSSSPLASPRPTSPAIVTGRSRQVSTLHARSSSENSDIEGYETPWEVFCWTKLRKLSGDAFSELGKRNHGRPTCMAVASLIAIGTSKGLILIFDFHQTLKTTVGLGTKAIESGAITAITLSADYSVVAGGHVNGNIFTWDISRPAKPFLSILATDITHLQATHAEGHVLDASVLHLGFLGTRHTALVSADVKGMAFSHLATRGLGSIVRSVRTARILGRYPETMTTSLRPRKSSSVLAFSSMPLGNSESAADELGLVAMLTPYLLVIVSTTPIAQTQHKASRPRELIAHGAMTGALAWYPAMKGKLSSSNPKLAYSWLNVVTILEIAETPNEVNEEATPDLSFEYLKRWKTEESIVAMQWLNHSVLAILTITQQLIILEDETLVVTDSSDLIKRHVYHSDLFSQQLSHMIENLEQTDNSMHGVVADAFYMSFKAYKGRLFLLTFNDVSIGTLSNWADRLFALMEQGDFLGAIQLATAYHTGGPDKAAIGLPMDEESRHELVGQKLLDMMAASLRYAFGKNPVADTRVSNEQLEHLASACFNSCLKLDDMDFLFEEVYTWYSENNASQIYLDILEPYIAEGEIKTVPPIVLKDLVNAFVAKEQNSKLEEILCLLDPTTMDLEQVTLLCQKFRLYDALFYIWSQAINDYTTVLKNLLAEGHGDEDEDEYLQLKIFAFLSYTLTGRIYPTGNLLSDERAFKAKSDVYHFLLSGTSGSSYLYLHQALNLDASSFLSMLNEAFEDNYLENVNHPNSSLGGFTEEEKFVSSLNRQYIIRVLLEVLVQPDYALEDTIYLDMFIARNQAKFPQFIRLPGGVLQRVMVDLCFYPSEEVAEDCQLSLEYLLSVYQPPDISLLLPDLETAKFYRVIKSIYRSEKQYAKLLETCLKDGENPDDIFDCIRDYLRLDSGLNPRQRDEFSSVLQSNIERLLATDLYRTADLIDAYSPDLHTIFVDHLQAERRLQFNYLQRLLEGQAPIGHDQKAIHDVYTEKYIRLMCDYDPNHVSAFINELDSSNLRLDNILPALENSGVIDAAIILIARSGEIQQAMERLMAHLRYLEIALGILIERTAVADQIDNAATTADDLIDSMEKYSKVGIWLCKTQWLDQSQRSVESIKRRASRVPSHVLNGPLTPDELLWLDLLDSIVRVVRQSSSIDSSSSEVIRKTLSSSARRLRNIVQDVFTALLTATSTSSKLDSYSNLSFLRILQAFLSRISEASPSLIHLRGVLDSIFSAYAYEENLLKLSNRLLDKDLFVRVEDITERRRRGWRPSTQNCNGCQKRVWGPGIGAYAWDAWYERQERLMIDGEGGKEAGNNNPEFKPGDFGKGKAKELDVIAGEQSIVSSDDPDKQDDSLIIFSCRHVWHRGCLEHVGRVGRISAKALSADADGDDDDGDDGLRCPLEV